MARQLNSDALGKKGESRFAELCVDAQLIPNKSDWDRTGWDFIVDWPFPKRARVSLDKRPSPVSCRVQVKTTWEGNGDIKVGLKAMERLAKEPKPSFIFVLNVRQDLSYGAAHVIHVHGKFLDEILRRLREAEAKGQSLAKLEFTFSTSRWAEPLPNVSGIDFCKSVERVVGKDLQSYIDQKHHYLKTAGFEPGAHKIKTSLRFKTEDELEDAFLGLRKIEAVSVEGSETRFGIPLPIPEISSSFSILEFQPNPVDSCKLNFRRNALDDPIQFDGKIYKLPFVLPGRSLGKILITTLLFRLKVALMMENGVASLQCDFTVDADIVSTTYAKPLEWKQFYALFAAMYGGPLKMEIAAKKLSLPIPEGFTAAANAAEQQRWGEFATLTAQVERFFRIAGAPNVKLGITDVMKAWGDVDLLQAFKDNPASLRPLKFNTAVPQGMSPGYRHDILYCRVIRFGSEALAYCAAMTIVCEAIDTEASWTSKEIELLSVCRLRNLTTEVDRFLDSMKREYKLQSYFLSGCPDDKLDEGAGHLAV